VYKNVSTERNLDKDDRSYDRMESVQNTTPRIPKETSKLRPPSVKSIDDTSFLAKVSTKNNVKLSSDGNFRFLRNGSESLPR
jgi:hypothetical protein